MKTAKLAIGPKSTLGVYSLGHCCIIRVMNSFKPHKLFLWVKPQPYPGTSHTHLVPVRSLQGEINSKSLSRFKHPRVGVACCAARLPFKPPFSPLLFAETMAMNGTLLSTERSKEESTDRWTKCLFFNLFVSEVLSDLRSVRHTPSS